ncbi:3-keto-disaccharide hydrolase [Rubritalea marina]|uniref:3-keto-disaccharide hydrolase n=1 Tax=Rubritalea marina TaxID=361055 RepID=UPI0003702ECC|nr:DUF1080 domain-containing protein [Rubritalea marina]
MKLPLISLAFLSSSAAILAAAPEQKNNNPKQPWSGYAVHEATRPHPKKVATNGAVTTAAPADAVVLFNGSDTAAWNQNWVVKDGIMIASPGNLSTNQSFGDCQLHIEWRVPAGREVSGQKGGNSGVFLMQRYEVQVQESHTNVTYADGQAGALYGQYPPLVNPSTPQGEWQSYDISFKAPVYEGEQCVSPARITVIHNGVVIHNNQAFHGTSTHRRLPEYPKNHPVKAPIMLQWHGDPIEFRNIWVREL